jgi:hypothetical protein
LGAEGDAADNGEESGEEYAGVAKHGI